jgi:hypothetical protein
VLPEEVAQQIVSAIFSEVSAGELLEKDLKLSRRK